MAPGHVGLMGVLLVTGLVAQEAQPWWAALPRPIYETLDRIEVASDWFEVYRVAPGVSAIYEPGYFEEVISYLIEGRDRAELFNSGLGLRPSPARRFEFPERRGALMEFLTKLGGDGTSASCPIAITAPISAACWPGSRCRKPIARPSSGFSPMWGIRIVLIPQ